MKPKAFGKYIEQLYAELAVLRKKAAETADVEAVHDMRVQIKRLNCVYHFLDESKILRIRKADYYRGLKQYFKTAGRLRDLQLHRKLLEHYQFVWGEYYPEYSDYVNALERLARDNFSLGKHLFPTKRQKDMEQKILDALADTEHSILHSLSVNFINLRLKQIEGYYLVNESEEYLHKTRQTIKELRYFLEIYTSCAQNSKLRSLRFDEIKKVEDILGTWNDKKMFTRDLRRFMRHYSLLHINEALPEYQDFARRIDEDAAKDIADIQTVLLRLISVVSLSLLRLK